MNIIFNHLTLNDIILIHTIYQNQLIVSGENGTRVRVQRRVVSEIEDHPGQRLFGRLMEVKNAQEIHGRMRLATSEHVQVRGCGNIKENLFV